MNKIKNCIFAALCLFAGSAYAGEQTLISAVAEIPPQTTVNNNSAVSTKTGVYKGADFIKITLKNKLFAPGNTVNMPAELVIEIQVLDENVKVKKWRLDIINSRKENAFTSYGETIPPVITWNGVKDGDIAEGKYKYIFTVEIWKKDKVTVEDGNITVDVTPPLALLKSSTDVAVISDDKLLENIVFSLSISDETGVDLNKTTLQILNAKNNTPIKSWTLQNAAQQNITWDGKDDIYDRLIPAGEYKPVLRTSDTAGNVSVFSKSISVIKCDAQGNVEDIVVKEKPKALAASVKNAVFFKSASSVLTDSGLKTLETLTALLKEYPANNVLIEGHTDSFECKKTKNDLELSNKRAQAVYDFFIKNGIAPERLQAAGYGKAKPAAPNQDIRTRILNRRTDITVLKIDASADGINKAD